MEDKITTYLNTLSELEQLEYLKTQTQTVLKNYKAKEKAVKAEFEYSGSRTGVYGGKTTTLTAKAMNDTQAYHKSLDALKIIINHL